MTFDSTEDPEFTVTGKPLSYYEPYFELVTQLLANGLGLAADREFLRGLDPSSVNIEEALRKKAVAEDTIRWRIAHTIDEIEARRAAEGTATSSER